MTVDRCPSVRRGGSPLRAVETVWHIPIKDRTVTKVDSKGRIVLPKEVRERLNITLGTDVKIREEDGKAVIEPEKDPEDILERMWRLVAETSTDRGGDDTAP